MTADEESRKLADWLAAATGLDRSGVARALELGDLRRAFVVHELADAGFRGYELVNLVMRLTGADEHDARLWIEAHARAHRSAGAQATLSGASSEL